MIDKLLEKVIAGVENPRNKAKKDMALPKFTVGMEEGIVWAALFGFDINVYYSDPIFNFEHQLKQKLFWLNNFDDDTYITTDITASVGIYFEYTLFGLEVCYQSNGIPNIETDCPLTKNPDLSLLPKFDFCGSGVMPKLIGFYESLKKIAAGRVKVIFPTWWRGPLDCAIQLRGYDNFIVDTIERPQFVHDLLKSITERRIMWYEEYFKFSGEHPDGAYIGDDWLNIPFISPAIFEEFVFPCYLELSAFHKNIYGIHSCGNQSPVQELLLQIPGIVGLECNPWMNLEQTVKNVPLNKEVWVNLHPVDGVLLSDEVKMESEMQRIKALCKNHQWIVSTGGLQKIHSDFQEDINKIKTFINVAKKVVHENKVREK